MSQFAGETTEAERSDLPRSLCRKRGRTGSRLKRPDFPGKAVWTPQSAAAAGTVVGKEKQEKEEEGEKKKKRSTENRGKGKEKESGGGRCAFG